MYAYTYIYICIHTHVYKYIFTYVYTCAYIHVCIYTARPLRRLCLMAICVSMSSCILINTLVFYVYKHI